LHLVGYLYYWQMGFNSVFKGLNRQNIKLLSQIYKLYQHQQEPSFTY